MRQFLTMFIAVAAMLAGFYLSARHFSEPVSAPPASTVASGDGLLGSFRPDFELGSNSGG
jgi:hypothetical protein